MAVKLEKVTYDYAPGSPFSYVALEDVSVEIELGKVTAIVGATGSGKSTLVQHLNGLLLPTEGRVSVFDHIIEAHVKPKGLKALRQRVGLVFQFPEMQLFDDSIYKDVSFGPKNFGMDEASIKENVEHALNLVGIEPELWDRSPLKLSGGQKRRVAIAGVLAANPDVIVLDEPTAGLDPQGSKAMMALFETLNKEYGKTIVMVTHDMDHVLNYCDRVIVMDDAKVLQACSTQEFFANRTLLERLDFVKPLILQLREFLVDKGFEVPLSADIDAIVTAVLKEVK